MRVDRDWLAQVRRKNQERFGMAGMSGMTTTGARDLVDGLNRQRDIRTLQIKEGLHEQPKPKVFNPDDPSEIVALLPEYQVQAATPLPKAVAWGAGLIAVGLVAVIGYTLFTEGK